MALPSTLRPGGGICPNIANSYFHCNVVSGSNRTHFGESELLWKGGALHLIDIQGDISAEMDKASEPPNSNLN